MNNIIWICLLAILDRCFGPLHRWCECSWLRLLDNLRPFFCSHPWWVRSSSWWGTRARLWEWDTWHWACLWFCWPGRCRWSGWCGRSRARGPSVPAREGAANRRRRRCSGIRSDCLPRAALSPAEYLYPSSDYSPGCSSYSIPSKCHWKSIGS